MIDELTELQSRHDQLLLQLEAYKTDVETLKKEKADIYDELKNLLNSKPHKSSPKNSK